MESIGSDDGSTTSTSSSGSRKRSAASTNQGPNRSVVDYDTEEQLREALLAFLNDDDDDDQNCNTQLTSLLSEIQEGQPVQKVARTAELQTELSNGLDWVLPAFDPETTYPQSLQDELKRLQVLKTYLVLDSKREEAFNRVTQLASRIFDVPLSMVSLVDLGRQFFLSNHGFKTFGLDDVRDSPRKFAFCSHAILNKDNILVVPDLTADFRFINNPFVAGPPFVKFYAGAPLVSPEGFKLGTICILDTVARPHGLTPEQCNTLMDLADMTVKIMVDRRYQLNKKKCEDPTKLIAYTAHDMMAPLSGVHLSLSILKNDPVVKASLGEHQLELLSTAASCSELMIRICKNALDGLRTPDATSSTSPTTGLLTTNEMSKNNMSLTNLKELVKSLQMIADPIPKKVPCIVTLDKAVPNVIIADDLKLFRSSVNLLTNAIDRTSTGMVHLSIRLDETLVLFECEDTGEDIPVDEYQFLFQPEHVAGNSHVGLSSIANLIDSLDGEYGFRPRGIDVSGNVTTDYNGRRRSGSIFWFSIPLILPEILDQAGPAIVSPSLIDANIEPVHVTHGFDTHIPSTNPMTQYQKDIGSSAACFATGNGSNCDDTIANFALAQGNASGSSPSMIDELSKLALDIDVSLADLEPLPLNNLSVGGNVNDIRRRRALVIDDSLVVRRSLVQALNSLGFDVVQANDGAEGLKLLEQSLYDLVLCDFLMPVIDGVTCVRQYRAWEKVNRPWDSQLIVGISANANINDNGQGLHAGMNAFLPKPITIKTLTDLQSSSEAVLRTRQLDEWEGNGYQMNTVGGPESLKAPTSELDIQASLSEPLNRNFLPSTGRGVLEVPTCLVACDTTSMQTNLLRHQLESSGWKVVIVNDGLYCLELLKMQTWTAALIEDDLTQLSGLSCVVAFRKWEAMNRTNVQKNIFLVCDGDIPSPTDRNSWIQPPNGFNGVLRKPVPLVDLQYMLVEPNSFSSSGVIGFAGYMHGGQGDVDRNTSRVNFH